MSKRLDILVIESQPWIGEGAARTLTDAGHRVHRCHEPGDTGYACVGIHTGGECPLDGHVDAAVLVRADADAPPVSRRVVAASLGLLLIATGVLYLWGLSASGYANSFYSAAAQAGGDADSMVALIEGCASAPSCRAAVARNARALRRPGVVRVLRLDSSTSHALLAQSGPTRVAWDVGGTSLPVVQCVAVERRGVPFLGGEIVLRSIGPKIAGAAAC